MQVALIADPNDAEKNDILRTNQSTQDTTHMPRGQNNKIIMVPPGTWLETIRLSYLPLSVCDDIPAWQQHDLKGDNYVIVYWRGRFLQIHKDHCYMPFTIGWNHNL